MKKILFKTIETKKRNQNNFSIICHSEDKNYYAFIVGELLEDHFNIFLICINQHTLRSNISTPVSNKILGVSEFNIELNEDTEGKINIENITT